MNKSIPSLRHLAPSSRTILCTGAASLLAVLSFCPSPARAATLVTSAGFTEMFDVMPAATEWSTATIAGGGADILDPAGMDAFISTLTAAQINQALNPSATPGGSGANALARYNTTELYVSTRPTGVRLTPLMATLENATGASITALDVAYDLGSYAAAAEDPGLDGHRVYFSLDGAAWTNIDALSNIGTPGNLSTTVEVGSWTNGSLLYLLWADDNANGFTDRGFTLDNVNIVPGTVVLPGDTIIWNRAHAEGGAPGGNWNLGGGNFWLNGAAPDSFANSDIAVFSQAGDTNINVTENVAPNSTQVSHATGTYTIGGAGRISGPIAKSGAGTLVLTSGNDFNRVSFDGGLIVSQAADSLGTGTFSVDGVGGTLQTDTDTTIGGIRGSGPLIKTGAGNLLITGGGSGNGGITVQTGKIQAVNGAGFGGAGQLVDLQAGTSLEMTTVAGETTYAGAIAVPDTGATLSVLNAGTGLILSSADSLRGSGTITIAGDGALRVRSENAELTSNFVVNSGTLEYGNVPLSALGSGSVTVNAGGRFAGQNKPFIPNSVILNGGDLATRSGDLTEFSGPVAVTAPSTATLISYTTPANSQSITLSGILSGASDLTINGNNPQPDPALLKALILTNTDNTFTGTFRVSAGQVLASESFTFVGSALNGRPVVLSNSTLRIRDDGTDSNINLDYGNNITVDTGDSTIDVDITAFGFNTGNTVRFGTLEIGAQTLTTNTLFGTYKVSFAGATTLTGDARIAANAETTLQGAISGAFGVTAAGFNTLRFNGANTYTGPTGVESGTLLVNGSTASASAVGVTGGILGGTGTVNGAVTASGSGAIAPGDGGRGILTVAGDLTMAAGTTLTLEIAHVSAGVLVAGTDYDRLVVGAGTGPVSTGQVILADANLALTLGTGIMENDLFFVLVNDGADPIGGTFLNRPDDSLFTVGAQTFMISYNADLLTNAFNSPVGNDVALLAIPEPGAASLLLAGALGLLSRRRRR